VLSLKRAPRRSTLSCRSGVYSILRFLTACLPALGHYRFALSLLSLVAFGGHAWGATCAPATSGGSAPADWPSYCWFDFSSYSDAAARSAAGQSFTFTLNDGSTLSFTVNVTSANTTALSAVKTPAWSGAAVGNTAFLGIPGKPILYTAATGTVTVKFSGITLTPPAGVTGGSTYSFVAADGESTNSGESLAFTTTGANWTILDKVPPISGSLYPTISNTGTTFTETGIAGTVGGYIVGSTSATTVSTTLVAGGLQGAMFALRYSAISLNKTLVGGRVNPADQFSYSISATSSGSTLGTGASTGTGNGPFTQTSSFITTQQSLTLTEAMSSSSVSSLANYSPSLTCTNSTAGSTTALPTAVATTSYVLPTIAFGDVIACTFTNTIVPPVLSLTKSAPSPGLQVGGNSVYTLTVTNSGRGPATTAQVKDQLPSNLTFVSAVGTGWSCTNASSLVTCAYSGNIPVGGTSSIAVTVSAPASAAGASDTNYASIDSTSGTSAPTPGATCTTTGSCASAGPNIVIYINPVADTGTAPAGTASTAIVNVAANDAVNGAAATLGSSGNATVSQVGTWPTGIALNAATGAVSTTAAVMPGAYSVQYQLCDKNAPANCATTTDTVTVTAAVVPVADTGTAVAGTASTPIANVAANDTVNGAAVMLAGAAANATMSAVGTWATGIALNPTTGAVTTTTTALPGSYSLQYQLCDKNTPVNCATTTDTVTVTAAIVAVAESGTAIAGSAATPIANVAANDTVNGAAATLGSAGNASVSQSGTWATGIALSTATGAITTTTAVAPGTYSLVYQLCDKNTPANCVTTTDTLTVTAAVVAVADTGSAVAGTASTPIANVATNDTVNGAAASPGSSGNATVAQIGTWTAGITLNTGTGAVTTTAAVMPGSYSLQYQLCDKNTPANCATTTDTVTVTAAIVATVDTGTAVSGTASTPIANAAANDTVNGAAATLGSPGNATVAQVGTWAAGIAFNTSTGAVTTTAAVIPGTYGVQYQLCDKNTPANCATTTDTVTVTAAIVPLTDSGNAVSGTASTPIANVAANDTVNGAAATLGSTGNATVAQSGTWTPGIALNTGTGAITTTTAVAPGSYSVAYQLCDKNTPANCATTTDTVTVTAAILPVADTGTAVAGTASTPVANVAANDTVNGAAATLGASGNATVAQAGTWTSGFALNSGTGAISMTAAVSPGSYTLQYELCDKYTPANCATATDSVTVAASIVPVAESGTAVAGTASTPIANVAANDTVNGATAMLGTSGNATVAQSGTWTIGITLNTASGAITTTAAVAPGSYSLQYQLCDKNTPANCATATDTVTVTAAIAAVADTGTAVAGAASTPIANVAANDTVNGAAATLGPSGNATVAQVGAWAAGIALNTSTGAITTTAAVAPGSYSLQYQLCDKSTPANCATTTDTVTVSAAIIAAADTGTAVAGAASTPIASVTANDTVNGAAATLGSSGNAVISQVGTWTAGIALNTTTGAVTTTAAAAPGSYSLQYQLCDKNTPANCTTTTDTVKLTAAIMPMADSGSAVAGTASTPIANVASNDSVNGVAASLGASGNAVVSPVGTWTAGIVLNTSTGAVTITAAVAPGSYSLQYQLCDKSTPANCATTTDTVTVTAVIVPVADSGTAAAGVTSTPIANVAANDKVNGAAATLGSSGNATVDQSGAWPSAISLNTATGAVTTMTTLAPGSYSLAYQLCDKNTPANCATVVDTVTVTAAIAAVTDTGSSVAGTASTPIANVVSNDTVNGAVATLGSSGNAVVSQVGTWTAGIALNASTGAVTATAAVAPGAYSLQYQLCDKNTPANCATATDTVTVSAAIVATADSGTAAAGSASTPIANVTTNDKVNGAAATLGSSGNAEVSQVGAWTTGIALNTATGAITTTAVVAPGSYSLQYQLCDKNTPANCAITTDTVSVTAAIVAVADTGTAAAGTASTPIANVAANDTVNGAAATLGASGNATVTQVGTWTSGITLNTAAGAIMTTASVAPGAYSLQYQLCDKNTPANCASATDTVTVSAAIVAAADSGTAVAGTASTPIANVTTNDKVNGAAATLGSSGNAAVSPLGTWTAGIALNTATGAITTAAAVAPGAYSLQYQLCDKSTPPNCATATDILTVTPSIAPVADTGTATAGTAATAIANVAANDTVNGATAVLSGAGANATVATSGTWPSGLALNTGTGAVTTTATLMPGSYSVAYQLCDKNTPPNCATTTDTVTVAASIVPVADTGTAVAGTASTPIANVAGNDTVNGAAAVLLGAAANATVAQSGTWSAGIALNTGTGAVTTTAAVAPGAYSVIYQLCDKNTPANCAVVTDTVTVTASILPVSDTGTVAAGTNATVIANVAANDTVNGAPAMLLGAASNATVAQSGTWPAGIALNTGSGAVTVAAAVAPGVYSVQYQLCDKDTPVNCATATATVTVTASIVPVADAGTAAAGVASTPVANVAANDSVNGAAALLTGASANAMVAQAGTWMSGIVLNTASGAITVTAAVAPGVYSLAYQLCDKNTPVHCAAVTDIITVTASILAAADTGTATAGVASTPLTNVAANDSINGSAAVIEGAGTNATVSQSGTWPSGLTLNVGTGAVTTTTTLSPGTYGVAYQLCDKNTPPDCATATVTVTVKAAIAPTSETGSAVAGSASTPIANVAANDTVNGVAAALSGTGANATVSQVGTWPTGITLNGATGAISTTTAAPAGTYSMQYQLCDKNSPPNCATATDTLTINDSIVIKPDPGTAVAGIPSTPIANVAAGASVNGQVVTLGSTGNSSVSMAGTWPAGIVLNTSTGAVSTTAAVPPGSYSFQYRLCAKAPPANCVMATDSIVVTANIVPAAYKGSAAAGTASIPIATVTVNDTVNGVTAVLGIGGNATVSQAGTWPTGFGLSAAGAVTVTAAVAPGTYSLTYQLCDRSSPANCATAVLSIKVSASILPATMSGTAVAGMAATPIANVAANGTVDGQAATLGASGNATVAESGVWPTGVVLDTSAGAVNMSAAVLPGTYSLAFQLCDKSTPPNCATATDTLVVKNTTGGSLVIDKSASKSQAEVGDSIQYRIHVRNPGTAAVIAVKLNDTLPLGFQLIPGSVLIGLNGATPTTSANPQGTPGPQLVWSLGNIAKAEIVEIDYRVRVAAGAERGTGINKAQAVGDGVTSSVATAQVQVTGGAFDTSACVAGKVYVDCNGNRVQDAGEPGIPGVRLYFEDGTNLTSDENGNYSICGQRPITHVLKVDSTTLPAGSRMVVVSSRNAGDGDSLFVDLRDGELHRADFAEGSCTDKVMQDVKRRRLHGPLLSPLPAAGREHMGVDFESLPNGETRISVPASSAGGAHGGGGAANGAGAPNSAAAANGGDANGGDANGAAAANVAGSGSEVHP